VSLQGAWEAARLYDPSSPTAPERLELVTFLHEAGCTIDEMVAAEAHGRLFALAGDKMIRGGDRRHSVLDMAAAFETEPATVRDVWRSLELEDLVEDDRPIATDADRDAVAVGLVLVGALGRDDGCRLLRTYAAAIGRATDAASAAFRAVTDFSVRRSGSELTTAQTWVGAAGLIAQMASLLDVTHRHHIDASRRHFESAGTETEIPDRMVRLAVGFVDLSGFTALSQTLDAAELTQLLATFESRTADLAREHGCRVVKFIGDAAMLVSATCEPLAEVADALVRAFTEPTSVRAGLAHGDIVAREGDYFGTAVNLAARIIAAAPPGGITASTDFTDHLSDGWVLGPRTLHTFRGFEEDVSVVEITRTDG
jgi:class 3 adenylate cyclase